MIGRRGSIVDASIILNGEAASAASTMRHSLRERRITPCFDIAMHELCQEIGRSPALANSLFDGRFTGTGPHLRVTGNNILHWLLQNQFT